MPAPNPIFNHVFENGLTLLGQPMPWLESAAFSMYVPAGCRFDPTDRLGLANFTCEMVQRGCGNLGSRDYIEALELLGVSYSSSVSVNHTHFGGAMPRGNLHAAMSIFADVLRNPHLPSEQLEDGRMVCFQELYSLQDDLAQRAIIELRRRFYGDPDGRIAEGELETVKAITDTDVREFYEANYRPNELIIAVAGNFDWDALCDHVGSLVSDWDPKEVAEINPTPPQHGVHHLPFESNQTHIAVAYPSLPYSDPNYFQARGAVGVLSDGMSSRLFAEIREKRGLCYTVFASSHSTKNAGAVVSYSGTSAERAQETLDVLIEQLAGLANGIQQNELDRLKVQIRSGLIMQQESCRSRSGSIASDWFHLGRVRTLDEINQLVNDLTVDSINHYLKENPPGPFDVVTLGPEALELKDGISATSA